MLLELVIWFLSLYESIIVCTCMIYSPFFFSQFQITLSGLLNFTDGLWSSCGDERIIIFITNHKDRLDPALLRPGRVDVHIHVILHSIGFKILASNYLGITEHPLFSEIVDIANKDDSSRSS